MNQLTETSQEESSEISQSSKKQKKHLTKFQIGLIITLVLVTILPVFVFDSENSSSEKQGTYVPAGSQAYITAQYFVAEVLKSPSTADFPSNEYSHHIVGGEFHVVTSYVDSENSFGATLRSTWTATLKYEGGDWADVNNWLLQQLVFDGEVIYTNHRVD